MPRRKYLQLSRRERQIMDILYREGRASSGRVRELIPDAPTYSAVRALLRILEEKECVKHESVGREYVYAPAVPREQATQSALGHIVETFFAASTEAAVPALIKKKKLPTSRPCPLPPLLRHPNKGEHG